MRPKKRDTRKAEYSRLVLRINAIIFLCILFMFLFVTVFQLYSNVRAARKTTDYLMHQIENIALNNDDAAKKLEETLKEDYIVRARAVAYAVQISDKELTLDQLQKMASLMNVDEIHFFNKNGTIVNGSVPEYYGYSMDDGEQIGFFKPMLTDTSLSLCQDMTPNTAENKSMMYAMVWREDLKGLIQVGIEPVRLLEELNSHTLTDVVNSLTVVEGESVYLADKATLTIKGATEAEDIGKTLGDIGLNKIHTSIHVEKLHGDYVLASSHTHDDDIICTTYSLKETNKGLPSILLIILLYLVFSGFIINQISKRMYTLSEEKRSNFEILVSVTGIYHSAYLIDLKKNEASEFSSQDSIRDFLKTFSGADVQMQRIMEYMVTEPYRESVLAFTDLKTLPERMTGKKTIYFDAIGKNLGWTRFSFITITKDDNNVPLTVLYTSQDIDEEKRLEEQFKQNSQTDELTQLFNRRAYDGDINRYKQEGIPDDLLLVAIDLNGLKATNDTLGHTAGDELIRGTAACMTTALAGFGSVYRIGGDEFAALLTIEKDKIDGVIQTLHDTVNAWKGQIVNEMSLSIGMVYAADEKGLTVEELENLADRRMYEAKREYYKQKGNDRRV